MLLQCGAVPQCSLVTGLTIMPVRVSVDTCHPHCHALYGYCIEYSDEPDSDIQFGDDVHGLDGDSNQDDGGDDDDDDDGDCGSGDDTANDKYSHGNGITVQHHLQHHHLLHLGQHHHLHRQPLRDTREYRLRHHHRHHQHHH